MKWVIRIERDITYKKNSVDSDLLTMCTILIENRARGVYAGSSLGNHSYPVSHYGPLDCTVPEMRSCLGRRDV